MPVGALHMIGLKIHRYSGKSKEYKEINKISSNRMVYYTCQD